jgi:hypothetical protein
MMVKKKEKSNLLGIIGLCVGWLVPLAGLVLGIISLVKKEKTPAIGIVSIVIAIIMWVVNMMWWFAWV